jgi:peptide deformylase
MSILSLIYAPNDIFHKIANPVKVVDDAIRTLIDDMFETMYHKKATGIAGNMVGILQRIAIVDLQENNCKNPYVLINPEIIWSSEEMQIFNEASICFLGISADIKRPKAIKLSYLDYNGKEARLEAEGFFATVIQHEVDYLNGTVFLDYLSKMKRDMLLKKMIKSSREV